MVLRRSERLNQSQNRSSVKQLLNPYSVKPSKSSLKQGKKEVHQGRYFNSPQIKELIAETSVVKTEIPQVEIKEPIAETPVATTEIPEVVIREPIAETPVVKTEIPEVVIREPIAETPVVRREISQIEIKEVTAETPIPPPVRNEKIDTKTKSPVENVSATTKALVQLEAKTADSQKHKKRVKIPTSLRKKKFNQRLSKLLTPKSAVILLQELKPGCTYNVKGQSGAPFFIAQVKHENNILGTGQGLSKSHAKNCAAESVIKAMVSKAMMGQFINNGEKKETNANFTNSAEGLPWAGLASFAIYKMFSEWQNQDALDKTAKPVVNQQTMNKNPTNDTINNNKKKLPPNALELHPGAVLNSMFPGLTAVELERENGVNFRVKIGYQVGRKMYTGEGGNIKFARREAAKAVLQDLFGLTYPD